MSSLRNAVNRRVHRERAQPQERARFGLLEKAKDRKLREQDHNRKKKTLKALRAKASERNEDEFFFGMLSRQGPQGVLSKGKRWNGTVDGDRGNRAMSVDEVRLLKTQDVGYVRTVRNTAAKDVRQLEERVVGLGGSLDVKVVDDNNLDGEDDDDDWLDDDGPARKKPKKIVFADGAEEREDRIAGALEDGDDDDDDDISLDGEDTGKKTDSEKARAEQRERLLLKLQRRLAMARKRLKVLSTAESELEMQRAKMAKTQTSSNGVTKTGKKFKVRERKR